VSKDYPEERVLDHGFVRLVDSMGDDGRVVDAARVSYKKGTKKVSTDRGLIRYLLRKLHTTPFEKVRFEFHVKLPVFVARQYMRHRMGTFNEVSARYSEMPDEFYIPNPLRKQSKNNKQGSSSLSVDKILVTSEFSDGHLDSEINPQEFLMDYFDDSYAVYQQLLESHTARELARGVLPVNIYTEFYWTVDLWNLMHFLRLRLDSHAQYEIRVYAEAIYKLIKEHCDLNMSLEAFQDYILDKPNLTKYEVGILVDLVKKLRATSLIGADITEIISEQLDLNKEMSDREKKESSLLYLLKDD